MVALHPSLEIEPITLPLNRVQVSSGEQEKAARRTVRPVEMALPGGRSVWLTDRFWQSFSTLFGLSQGVFEYFGPEEVFDRITRVREDPVRICLETRRGRTTGRALTCTDPSRPLVPVDEARRVIDRYGGDEVSYGDGVVTASFECPYPIELRIGGDDYRSRFTLRLPVDGYGLPAAYLSLLRHVCDNGMVGYHPAFRTTVRLGKGDDEVGGVLDRVMTTFNNEEGFHALKQRVEAANSSWASLREAMLLQRALEAGCTQEGHSTEQRSDVLERYNTLLGAPLSFYGLTSGRELSSKRARTIPVSARVQHLFNFASEVSTHRFHGQAARGRVNAWIGDTLVQEYDLEGTADRYPEFRDYFMESP